jgi:beta-glucosidase
MAEASAWDERLTYRKYAAVSREAWENRRTVHLAPGLSAARTPLAARPTEYLGEDSLRSGVLAASAVRGLQEANDRPTLSTIKHWVANEQRLDEEESSSNIDERPFREIYNLPFEIAITEGEPGAIMCSYNMINAVSACEQPLQTDLLKGELGFDGFIMSDFGGVYSAAPSPERWHGHGAQPSRLLHPREPPCRTRRGADHRGEDPGGGVPRRAELHRHRPVRRASAG